MITLLKKQPTVEQIHAEFDSAEERILSECDKILSELKIPTETQIERKASIMKEIGFINSETVKQAQALKKNNELIQKQLEITSKQANFIKELKQYYPFEKFITVDELERICSKYNLIHAPIANYIKDVPEKNLLEIKNCKKLLYGHKCEILYKVTFSCFLNLIQNKEYKDYIGLKDYRKIPKTLIVPEDIDTTWRFSNFIKKKYNIEKTIPIESSQFEKIDKSGLFIAAPKSHFDLKGLKHKSKFGFFKTEILEVKDPVVFEYCKNDICRIITKWGTDDDQSYLDPNLINETLN
jgi:hypothetical protein